MHLIIKRIDAMDDRIIIKLNIAGRMHPMRIAEHDEERIRKAAKIVSEHLAAYQLKYRDSDLEIKDLFSFVACQMAFEFLELAENKNNEPLLDKIKDLNTDLEDYLKEK